MLNNRFYTKIISEYIDLDKYRSRSNEYVIYCIKDTDIWHNPYGPAYININGNKVYYIEGKIHRLDGPATIFSNFGKYYINGKSLTKEEFEKHPERLKYLGKEHLICLK